MTEMRAVSIHRGDDGDINWSRWKRKPLVKELLPIRLLKKYFESLHKPEICMYIPMLDNGSGENQYYVEPVYNNSEHGTLRFFIDVHDLQEYIVRESATFGMDPGLFNLMEVNFEYACQVVGEIAESCQKYDANLKCVVSIYYHGNLMDIDTFWTNDQKTVL